MRSRFFSLAVLALLPLAVACGGASETSEGNPSPSPAAETPGSPPDQPSNPNPPATPTPTPSACDGSIYIADVAKWQRAGSNPKGYEMKADPARAYCDKPGAHVRSLSDSASKDKFGTFMDVISAAPYRGKRVRLRGVVETANVSGWSGLWLRVDSSTKEMLAFDNMGKRALRGTLAPAEHAVVLDVPNEAAELAFGVLLSGSGEVWTKQVVIEIVGTDVPTTGS